VLARSITLTRPLEFSAIGMKQKRHNDHTEHEASQAETYDQCDGRKIHEHLLSVAIATTTTTKQERPNDEGSKTEGYQKPEIDL
jgi:hypothetical protein